MEVIMTIELPEPLSKQLSLADVKLFYNQDGQASEVLMSYEVFQKIINLLQKPYNYNQSYFRVKEATSRSRKAGSGKHLKIIMSDDFDEPLEDFAEYMW
jgi:hypothetical protein